MHSNEFLTTLGALAKPSGLSRLRAFLEQTEAPLTPEEEKNLSQFVASELQASPQVTDAPIRIRPGLQGHGYYAPTKNEIYVGRPSPEVLGHELGHAKSLPEAGPTYKLLHGLSRKLYNLGAWKVLPAIAAIHLLTKGRTARKAGYGLAATATAASSLPVLYEEAQASLDALKHAPEKTKAIAEYSKALGSYGLKAAVTPFVLHSLRKLL